MWVKNFFLSISMLALCVQLQLATRDFSCIHSYYSSYTCTVFLILELWSLSRSICSFEETIKQPQDNTDKECTCM